MALGTFQPIAGWPLALESVSPTSLAGPLGPENQGRLGKFSDFCWWIADGLHKRVAVHKRLDLHKRLQVFGAAQ